MRIKRHFLPCFLLAVAILFFIFISPAFSEFRKVNECELARTNASVTGQPAAIRCVAPASWEEEQFECKSEHAFDACTAIPAEGEPITKESNLYSIHGDHEYDWLKKTQDFMEVYNPVYNPLSPISVEAGTDSYGLYYAPDGSTYIRIGLGSQEVGLDEMDILVTLGSEAAREAGQAQILGSLYVGGLSVKTNGSSYVTLYKVDGQMGLGVNVDAAIDRIRLNTLSWGDADGFPSEGNTSKAGYVGLKNTDITGVNASGPISIDVQTDDKGELSLTKFIHMGIGTQDSQGNPVNNLNVGIASLDTTVVVGDKKDFSGNTSVLGTVYMKNLEMNVNGYLDIYNLQDKEAATGLDFGLTIPSLKLDTLSWGDTDGLKGVEGWTGVGGVGLRRLAISNLAIKGQATVDTATLQTIVNDDDGIPFSLSTPNVRIGLSNLGISMASLDADVALGDRKDNLNQILGSVYLGGLDVEMNGLVDIHTPSPSTQGIVLELDASFPKFFLRTLSWGDADGVGLGTPDPVTGINPTAGYVGLRDLTIDGLKVAGRVSVDVATVESIGPMTTKELTNYHVYDEAHKMSPSFVHIGLGTGNPRISPTAANGRLFIGLDSLSTDVVVDSVKTLANTSSGTLGSFYIKGLAIGINGWVDIGAH